MAAPFLDWNCHTFTYRKLQQLGEIIRRIFPGCPCKGEAASLERRRERGRDGKGKEVWSYHYETG